MASVGKIAEMIGKGAGKAKLAAGKMASGAVGKAKSMNKKDIAASVRGAVKPKPKFAGLSTDKTMGTGAKVAGGVAGAAAAASAFGNKSPDRQAKETGTPNVGTKVVGSPKPTKPASKPAAAGQSGNKSPDRTERMKPKGSVYRAKKGDGLWQVAEKTVPKGQSVSAWWAQIKKLNSTNGKVNRTYQNTGVKLPPGAQPKDKGYETPKPGPRGTKGTLKVD